MTDTPRAMSDDELGVFRDNVALVNGKYVGIEPWTPTVLATAAMSILRASPHLLARLDALTAAVEALPEPTLGKKGGVSRAAVLAILRGDTDAV